MTLLKSATFAGLDVFAADVDAPTFRRSIVNAQADLAGIFERATDKDHPSSIDHSAPGRGAPLSYPPASLSMGYGLRLSPGGAKNGGIDNEDIWFPFLVFIPAQEDTLVVDVGWSGSTSPTRGGLQVLDLTGGLTYALTDFSEVSPGVYRALVLVPVTGGLRALAIRTFGRPRRTVISDNPASWQDNVIRSVLCHCGREFSSSIPVRGLTQGVRVPAPSAGVAVAVQQIDDKHVNENRAITGALVTAIDGNLNALEEWASGSPAGGNGGYTATESALTNPDTSRFRSFSRKGDLSNEPLPAIPVASWSLGGQKATGDWLCNAAAPPTEGALESFAPFPATGSKTAIVTLTCHIPDMPNLTGAGWRVACLLGKTTGSSGNWSTTQVTVDTIGGAVGPASPAAIVGPSGTGPVALVQFSGLVGQRDDVERITISLERTGTYALGDHNLLAVCLWYAP
jgi:hypothetical protein